MRVISSLTALSIALAVIPAIAADEYHAPEAFNGHAWGEPLSSFPGLTLLNANTAQGAKGKVVDSSSNCTQTQLAPAAMGRQNSGDTANTCLPTGLELDQRVEGRGSFAVAEYYQKLDKNPWPRQGIQVSTITYLYCASAIGTTLPHPLQLSLCGGRVAFMSDKLSDLAKLGSDYKSNYDRILRRLIDDYGPAPGYQPNARVIVEGVAGSKSAPQLPSRYTVYRWCGTDEASRALHPTCSATVTLEFDATVGAGVILFATNTLYDYAYARNAMGDVTNDLYTLLLARSPERPRVAEKETCTGTLICSSQHTKMSDKELREFQAPSQ